MCGLSCGDAVVDQATSLEERPTVYCTRTPPRFWNLGHAIFAAMTTVHLGPAVCEQIGTTYYLPLRSSFTINVHTEEDNNKVVRGLKAISGNDALTNMLQNCPQLRVTQVACSYGWFKVERVIY